MPRFFFVQEDQLDEFERQIGKLPGAETRVTYKLLDLIKEAQQLPGKLMEALLKGPVQADGQPPPPQGPPASVGKPESKASVDPPTAAQIAKGASAVAVTSTKD